MSIIGAYGGGLSWEVILILGISNVFADAIAMGAGEYLSSKAHRDYVLTEKRREQWEYKNYKEGEVKEMVILFSQRGMGLADAELVVRKMAEYEDFFVDLMVTEELGLTLPGEDEASLLKDAFAMFISFLLFGTFPLLPFFLGPFDVMNLDNLIITAFVCTGVCLFCLGAFKSTFRRVSHMMCIGSSIPLFLSIHSSRNIFHPLFVFSQLFHALAVVWTGVFLPGQRVCRHRVCYWGSGR
jgi:vacuolar iron transporter family protein